MKKSQVIAITALTTALIAGTTLYLLRKKKQHRRLATVSDAGYETAYDVHYPLKYRRGGRRAQGTI